MDELDCWRGIGFSSQLSLEVKEGSWFHSLKIDCPLVRADVGRQNTGRAVAVQMQIPLATSDRLLRSSRLGSLKEQEYDNQYPYISGRG